MSNYHNIKTFDFLNSCLDDIIDCKKGKPCCFDIHEIIGLVKEEIAIINKQNDDATANIEKVLNMTGLTPEQMSALILSYTNRIVNNTELLDVLNKQYVTLLNTICPCKTKK